MRGCRDGAQVSRGQIRRVGARLQADRHHIRSRPDRWCGAHLAGHQQRPGHQRHRRPPPHHARLVARQHHLESAARGHPRRPQVRGRQDLAGRDGLSDDQHLFPAAQVQRGVGERQSTAEHQEHPQHHQRHLAVVTRTPTWAAGSAWTPRFPPPGTPVAIQVTDQ